MSGKTEQPDLFDGFFDDLIQAEGQDETKVDQIVESPEGTDDVAADTGIDGSDSVSDVDGGVADDVSADVSDKPGDSGGGTSVADGTTDEQITISKAELDDLRTQLSNLSAKVLDTPAPKAAQADSDAPATEALDFIGELDIDEVVTNPELLNQVLNKVLITAQQRIGQAFCEALPTLVQPTIHQTLALDRAVNRFYDENPLLGNFRPVVGQVTNQLQAANPEASLDELLPKIAEESYRILKIDPKAVKQTNTSQRSAQRSGLPRAGAPARVATVTEDLDEQAKQIADLFG